MDELEQRYTELCKELNSLAPAAQLLAVSKGQPIDLVHSLYALGQRAFGENYLRDAQQKMTTCDHLTGIQWHYIGPLQRNKTRHIAEHFDWVHSVDRVLLIKRLAEQRPKHKPPLNVLLQINVDNEQQKSGASSDQIPALVQTIGTYSTLRLRGIMGIPKQQPETSQQHRSFTALQDAYHYCQSLAANIDTLSMGMSGDWRLAVQHGATMVRIGTALFGSRI